MKRSELIVLTIGLTLCGLVFSHAVLKSTVRKTIYTVEVYEIFEVTHTANKQGDWTNVYTYGKGQFFFRGDHPINESSSYSFTYVKNGKRWRDLTLISYREFIPLEREVEEDCGCPG